MSFVVAHVRKIKTTVGLSNVIGHNTRSRVYDDKGQELENTQTNGVWYNPKNGKYNQIDEIDNLAVQREKLLKIAQNETEAAGSKWRKPSKNAAAGVELVLTASADFAENWETNPVKKAKVEKYLKTCREWASKKYAGSILHMAEHWDEKTPHLHVIMVPITRNVRPPRKDKDGKVLKKKNGKEMIYTIKDGAWRYSSGDFFGGRTGLSQLQNEIGIIGKEFGLARGEVNSRAEHTTLEKHDKELKTLPMIKTQLEKDISETKTQKEALSKQAADLQQQLATVLATQTAQKNYRQILEKEKDDLKHEAIRLKNESERLEKLKTELSKTVQENYVELGRMFNDVQAKLKIATTKEANAISLYDVVKKMGLNVITQSPENLRVLANNLETMNKKTNLESVKIEQIKPKIDVVKNISKRIPNRYDGFGR